MSIELADEDVKLMLAAKVHLGHEDIDAHMAQYVFKRTDAGVHIINLQKTWEKLILAAKAIAAIRNPEEVCVISAVQFGQRAIYKFAQFTGSNYIANRFTPGTFTNQIQKRYMEPRLLVLTDPSKDHQARTEAGYVNLPVIAFADTNSPLENVDIAIPCNNRGRHSLAVMYWLLAREVLRMRGTISRMEPWNVMVDLFIYRDPEDVEKETRVVQQSQQQTQNVGAATGAPDQQYGDINALQPAGANAQDWAEPDYNESWAPTQEENTWA